ncbi:MAG: Nif3-like dinuclear metal center hexameric protein [Marinilabiliaceae bacterium]|jgi:dinuclear metal center YbgI/SA1388 family protein|nr:Nif3-like dinuclear metal center hexameric protein [Marinilabiliaceae bacterium]
MKIPELTSYLSERIPLSLQEDYDNSGLQLGDPGQKISKALLALDITEEVVDEAINEGAGIIISHHPLIFPNLRSINAASFHGRIIYKAIKNNIAIYSAHTNLDNLEGGVSYRMAEKIGLSDIKALDALASRLLKIVTFVPPEHLEKIKNAMFGAGAGSIGKYDRCSFSSEGTGTFRASGDASPFVGQKGSDHHENEIKLEMIMPDYLEGNVIKALLDAHPYEEVAYDIYRLENKMLKEGMGCVGKLKKSEDAMAFLERLADIFDARGLRYSGNTGRKINTVALCGGAGASLISRARQSGADIYISGDIKYHSFFETGDKMIIADLGHYESEKFSLEILYEIITKKFPKFAVRFSKSNTNPINYLQAWKK